MKYPFLISGAISSSGPLEATERFSAFDLKVQQGLPQPCRQNVAQAIAALDRRVHHEDTVSQALNPIFHVCKN